LVKRRLKPSERKRFRDITRGLPQLRKLRDIMEHISDFSVSVSAVATTRGNRMRAMKAFEI